MPERRHRPSAHEQRPLDLDRFRLLLQETRSQLESDVARYRISARDLGGGPDEPGPGDHWEHSGYGDHQADEGTELFEREKAVGMDMALSDRLRQVAHAFSRLEDGQYGTCEACGRPIATARLEAMPEATLCIECKAASESHDGLRERAGGPAIR